jgi:hypothetical protein
MLAVVYASPPPGAAHSIAPAGCQLRQRRIPCPSRRRSPEAPALPGNPRNARVERPCSRRESPHIPLDRKRQDRPVTLEVAGSSPVAPAKNVLQMGMFCCQDRRERPPALRVSHPDSAITRKWVFCRHSRPVDPAMPRLHSAREFCWGATNAVLRLIALSARSASGRPSRYSRPSPRVRRGQRAAR